MLAILVIFEYFGWYVKLNVIWKIFKLPSYFDEIGFARAKGLLAELAPLHAQSVWESRGERVQVAVLTAYCNYLSKKKKKGVARNDWDPSVAVVVVDAVLVGVGEGELCGDWVPSTESRW